MIRCPESAAAAVAALTMVTATGLAGTTQYRIVDLGDPAPNGCFCTSRAVNAAREVAGIFFGADSDYNGFVATGGVVIDFSPPGENRTQGLGINDAGLVVGWTTHFDGWQKPILYDGQNVINLGTLGGRSGTGRDINNANQIVGNAWTPMPEEDSHAALWQDGEIIDLGTLGGPLSDARAVNELGMIVGWSWNVDWDRRPVFWTPDLQGPFELPSFAPPDLTAMAMAVNDAGQIVGEVQVESPNSLVLVRAALWDGGEVTDLGLLAEAGEGTSIFGSPALISTRATGINNDGVIVGNSDPPAEEPEVRHGAFVYRDGQMTNLNDLLHASASGWMVMAAGAINDDGVIAGDAQFNGGDRKAVLLVPVEPAGCPVEVNGDGTVNVLDLIDLLLCFGLPAVPGCTSEDVNDDGSVNVLDLIDVLLVFGQACP